MSVFENLRCGVLWSLGYKYTFLKFLADLDDANDRAEQLLHMTKLDRKRDCFSLARIQVLKEFFDAPPVACRCYRQPWLRSKVDRSSS